MQKDLLEVPAGSLGLQEAAAHGIESKPVRVLLICDDLRKCREASESIGEAGPGAFAIEYTDQLSIGLNRLSKGGIDVIICALGAPDVRGRDILGSLHSQAPAVPVVVVARSSDEVRDMKLLGSGLQEFVVSEPPDGNLLVSSMHRAIQRQKIASQLDQKIRSLQSNIINLRNIPRSNAGGIIIVNQQGIVCFVNPAAELLFSYKAKRLLGKRFDFIPDLEGEAKEFTISAADGATKVVEMRVANVVYQNEPAYLASLWDITEFKSAEKAAEATKIALEEALSKAKEETRLAQEKAEATRQTLEKALNKAREEAKAARIASAEALGKANEETRLAQEEAEATKQSFKEALSKANKETRLAQEKAEATRKSLEEALNKANQETRQAQEATEATRKELAEALAKANENAKAAKLASAEALHKAKEETRLTQREADVTKQALEEALNQANKETRLVREEAEATKQVLEDALRKADEQNRQAKEKAEAEKQALEEALNQAREEAKAAKLASAEALRKAKEETKLTQEKAEVTKQALEEALNQAREEAEATKQSFKEALSKANKETRLAREEADATRKELAEALVKADEENRQAKAVSRKADSMQSQYMSNILHELRTPLHSIIGFTKLVLEGQVADPATQKEFLTIINKQSEQLRDLIEELVDVSNIESDRFEVQKKRIPIKGLIQGVVAELYSITNKRNIALSEDLPATLPEINADEKRLKQVMFNLLDNAIKFSDDGSHINVKAAVNNDKLLVAVSDQGAGIAAEDLPSIFEKYYRARDSAKAAGLGLGLYISRQIIEEHGGRIWAESARGKGSTFSFTLPLEQAEVL